MAITSVWSAFGHRFMSTDSDEHESCLSCGAMYVLRADDNDPTRGEYTTAGGDQPRECDHDTSKVHGYSGERHCDECSGEGCDHCGHDCNCVSCDS